MVQATYLMICESCEIRYPSAKCIHKTELVHTNFYGSSYVTHSYCPSCGLKDSEIDTGIFYKD